MSKNPSDRPGLRLRLRALARIGLVAATMSGLVGIGAVAADAPAASASTPLHIVTGPFLPAGTKGQPYTATLAATGGTSLHLVGCAR